MERLVEGKGVVEKCAQATGRGLTFYLFSNTTRNVLQEGMSFKNPLPCKHFNGMLSGRKISS